MSRRRCCCPCWWLIEDFDRADSTDVGSKWYEWCTGDWSIENDRLKEAGTTDAIIPCTVQASIPVRQVLYVWTANETNNRKWRIHVNREAYTDCDKWYYVEYEIDGSGKHNLRIVAPDNVTLDEALDFSYTGTSRNIKVCVTEIGIQADATETIDSWVWADWDSSYPYKEDGRFFALGNGTDNPLYFGEVWYGKHWVDDPDCPRCSCVCYDAVRRGVPPQYLTATFRGYDGCAGLDGFEMTLGPYDKIGGELWEGEDTATGCDGNGGTSYFHFKLTCEDFPLECSDWQLDYLDSECFDSDGGANPREPASGCTCNPLFLTFGPYSVAGSDLACGCCGAVTSAGTFYIDITEQGA